VTAVIHEEPSNLLHHKMNVEQFYADKLKSTIIHQWQSY